MSVELTMPNKQSALNWLWPPECPICRQNLFGCARLCPDCWSDIHWLGHNPCRYCGQNLRGEHDLICRDCHRYPRPWDHGYACAEYDGVARRMILMLKHNHVETLACHMATAIHAQHAPALQKLDMLTGMPVHWRRRMVRGFNQAGLIAHWLAKSAGVPYQTNLIRRHQHTPPQGKGKRFDARFENVENAFSAGRMSTSITGAHIGLVDDVMTSGASLHAVSQVLRKAGAREISVFVFARAGLPR